MDDIEDLESMRRRIREEGRIRREHELQRRREAEASRRRRRERASSCSSNSSRDLLLMSSPSPPPPSPPDNNIANDMYDSDNSDSDKKKEVVSEARQWINSVERNNSDRKLPASQSTNNVGTNRLLPSNTLNSNSDSSSDIDLSQMSYQLAERNKIKNQKMKNSANNSKKNNPLSNAWWSSDSEDEDELDVRQLVARQNAEKKKKMAAAAEAKQTKSTTTNNSMKEVDVAAAAAAAAADSKPSAASQVNESQTSSEYTPKISNIAAEIGKQLPNVRGKIDGVKKLDYIREEDSNESTTLNRGAGTVSSEQANGLNRDTSMTSDNNKAMQKVDDHIPSSTTTTTASAALKSDTEITKPDPPNQTVSTDPIIGKEVRNRANVDWIELKKCLLVRAVGSCSPKDRVASFDLDHTLVNWRIAGWPSRPEHYELWNESVIEKCRKLHDDGYKLVIFSNQGGIKSALSGKKAGTVKGIIDWIAKLIERPVYAVVSTKSDSGYHKGNAGMWQIMEDYCNCGKQVSPELSFFVGDADGVGDSSADAQRQQHQQTGTDKLFAVNVGKLRKQTMDFHTPNEYFGDSNVQCRRTRSTVEAPPPLSKEAIFAHTALLGGYFANTPILLILVGVQGSGKSTFTKYLTDNSDGRWCQFSQDTIKDGGPGTRQAVEQAAKEALKRAKNVVIDRMHLDSEQRGHFVQIGKECQVSIHALVMLASKEDVADRVKKRTNHPGKVEGENGARIAVSSVSKLIYPSYDEGFELISYSRQINDRIRGAYCQVGSTVTSSEIQVPKTIQLYNAKENVALSMLTLGTMGIKKNVATSAITQALHIGVQSIDTAPTYGNESEIGDALRVAQPVSVTIKVPKRATSVEQVREEVMKSLSLLQQSRVDVILLHWPCDFIEANTLADVWKELESIKKEGKCLAIGVSNFTIMALKQLLSSCTIKPALNQVERHPLLPQYDLLQYCQSQDIIVQAHSPLGGGCGRGSDLLLGNNTITRVAQEAKMSPAQVIVCWNIQQNIPIFTKFSSEHGKEFIALFQEHTKLRLSPEQMKSVDNLGRSIKPHRSVSPPFMYRKGASYSWGDTPPSR